MVNLYYSDRCKYNHGSFIALMSKILVLRDIAVHKASLLFLLTAVVDAVVSYCVHDGDIDDGDRDNPEDSRVMLTVMVILRSLIVLDGIECSAVGA